jgi:hypothetical protein
VYAFQQASQDETRIKQAKQWIQYAEYEKNRQEELGLTKSSSMIESAPSNVAEPSS